MADIPASTSTTAGIAVGGTVTGSLEVVGDHDWFKMTLSAGQSVTITVNGTTLEDPYLRIRNSSGTVIHENDDISSGSGDDLLEGLKDDDRLRGGTGDDVLRGGDGDDRLQGGPGDDRLDGGPGVDSFRGGPGNDTRRG